MQSPDFESKGARSARSSRLRPMNSALPGQNLLQGVSPVKRIRPTMLLLFTGILVVLVFFGAQLKVPTVSAFPFYSSSSVTAPASNTCANIGCHSGTVTSGGNAVITVSPSTMTYTPGSTTPIQLSVNVTDAASTRTTWGYILTARLTNSPSSQAGSWTLIDVNSSIAPNALSPSILDLKAATYASSIWTFEWTPPPAGTTDSVTFYLTGLAVNPLIVPVPTDTGMYQSTLTLTPAITVPSVVGATQAAATTTLTAAGLTLGTVTTASSSTVASGSVISQNPISGTQVTSGSAVNLVVSSGPAPVTVPSVVGATQTTATTTLTAAGLKLGTVTTASSSTVASGSVISQNPISGTQVTSGSAVNLVVSSGPAPVTVPSVVGATQAAATTTLTAAGLKLGTVTTASS